LCWAEDRKRADRIQIQLYNVDAEEAKELHGLVIGAGMGVELAQLMTDYEIKLWGTQLCSHSWLILKRFVPGFSERIYKLVGGLEILPVLQESGLRFTVIYALRSVSNLRAEYNKESGRRVGLGADFLRPCSNLQPPGGLLIFDVFTKTMEPILRKLWGTDEGQDLERCFFEDSFEIRKALSETGYELLSYATYSHAPLLEKYFQSSQVEFEEVPTHIICIARKRED